MSLGTWTPDALSSERRRLSCRCWRIVEAQHRVSTMKLVDTLAEQERLELLLEASKPPLPPECQHLHYLLATPFRYGAPYPRGSRFRRAGLTPGVFYASATARTAVAEMAFHRLLFFAESPATPWPSNAGEYTAFAVQLRSASGLDLTAAPLAADRERWTHTTDYAACQELADTARIAGVELLKYESVRDPAPKGGIDFALLTCRAFVCREPLERQTWRMLLGGQGVHAFCDDPDARLAFDRKAFADDPRIAAMTWDRP
jgi:hypothetical protein